MWSGVRTLLSAASSQMLCETPRVCQSVFYNIHRSWAFVKRVWSVWCPSLSVWWSGARTCMSIQTFRPTWVSVPCTVGVKTMHVTGGGLLTYLIIVCVICLQARSIRLTVREESWSFPSWQDVETASARWTPPCRPVSWFPRPTIRSSMRSSNSRRTSSSMALNCESAFSLCLLSYFLFFLRGCVLIVFWFFSHLFTVLTRSQSEVSNTCRTRACWDPQLRTSPSFCTRRTDWTLWEITHEQTLQNCVLKQQNKTTFHLIKPQHVY